MKMTRINSLLTVLFKIFDFSRTADSHKLVNGLFQFRVILDMRLERVSRYAETFWYDELRKKIQFQVQDIIILYN